MPDLTIDKTHAGTSFLPGGSVTFTLTPNNVGNATTSGVVTITDTLPAGLTATSISGGAAWTCVLGTLTCTSTGSFTHIPASSTGTQPITLVAAIGATAVGTLVNNTAVSGGGEINTTNNTDTDSIVVSTTSEPDLTLAKTHDGTSFNPGGSVTFRLTPSNVGSAITTGVVTVADSLPSELTATSISGGAAWTCTLATLTCSSTGSFVHIPAGGTSSQPITLVASISPLANGVLVNNAQVGGGGESNTANNRATDQIAVAPPDLVLSKTHSGSVFAPGDNVTFTLTPSNIGSTPTRGTVKITDTLPAGLTAVSISGGSAWSCTLADLTCLSTASFTAIPAGGTSSQPVTLVARIASTATGVLVNRARVDDGGEVNNTNNTASDSISLDTLPDLTISKTHAGTEFAPGGSVTFSLTVTNLGPGSTSGLVTVTDTLPTGLTATAISGSGWSCAALPTLSCTRSEVLGVGASYPAISLTALIASNASGTLVNNTRVDGGGETNTANNTASDQITVQAHPDPTISKSHTDAFVRGGSATYSIVVTNVGAVATSGTITVTDTLPTGLTATAISGSGWTCTLSSLSCDTPAILAPGASLPAISVAVAILGDAPDSLVNVAVVSGGGDINLANNRATDPATLTGSSPQLSIAKETQGPIIAGSVGAYLITVSNVGGAPTSGVITVEDPLTEGLTGLAISGPGWTCSLATLSCTRGDALAPGASYPPVTVTVQVARNAPAEIVNVARTKCPCGPPVPFTEIRNRAGVLSVSTTLKVTKAADRTQAQLGDLIGYSIKVTNQSPVAFTSAEIRDRVPSGFEFQTGSARLHVDGGLDQPITPAVAGDVLTFTLRGLGGFQTQTVTYLLRVPLDGVTGDSVNSAQVTASGPTGATSASPAAFAGVRIEQRALSLQQLLIGRVYEDLNENGSFDRDERPIAGARLYLSNGQSVTTDATGLYSIPYVAKGSIVVSLDSTTVPKGYKISSGNRADAESWSRLVRTPLLSGMMLRQNFGLTRCPCDQPQMAAAPAPIMTGAVSSRPASKLEIIPGQESIPGDGRSTMSVRVRVLDDQGQPTVAREVRLRTSAGQFVLDGTSPRPNGAEPRPSLGLTTGNPLFGAGTEPQLGLTTEQVPESRQASRAVSVQGEASFLLMAANQPGIADLVAESGDPAHLLTGRSEVQFTPEKRTPILVTNGELSIGRAAPDVIAYGQRELTQRHLEAFLRTPLGTSDALVTLAYQSELHINESNGNAGLFQLDPLDRLYPVTGDASTRYQAAQSNSKVYGRLDFKRSYAQFGDMRMGAVPLDDAPLPSGVAFSAQRGAPQTTAFGIGDYNRKVVGAAIHLENARRQSITIQGARPDTAYARDVFGGSAFGLVQLSHPDILPGSETGVVEVRDVHNPEILLSRETLVRSVDYAIDPISGGLFFLRTLNAYDQSLNLLRLVFTYEYRNVVGTSTLYGVNSDLRFGSLRVRLGVTDQEDSGTGSYRLGTISAHQQLPRGGRFNIEVPISHGSALAAGYSSTSGLPVPADVNGAAVRADLDQPLAAMNGRVRASFARTDRNFFNPFGATVIPGAQTVRGSIELSPVTGARLTAGVTDERNRTTLVDNQRQGGSLEWTQAVMPTLSLTAGYDFRDFQDDLNARQITSHEVAAGIEWRPSSRFSASARREQNLGDSDPTYPDQTLLAARYQATETARLFLTQRLAAAPIVPIGDLSSAGFGFRPSRNETTIGVEDRWSRYSSIQSRYLIEDGVNGTDSFAVIGLVNRLPISRHFSIDLGGERGQAVGGSGDSFNTGSVGFSWLPERNLRASTRYELRDRDGLGQILTTGASGKLSEGLTVLGRYQYSSAVFQPGMGAIDLLRTRTPSTRLTPESKASHGVGALAWRPWKSDREALLFAYTRRASDIDGLGGLLPRTDTVSILSADGYLQPARALELYGKVAMSDRRADYQALGSVTNTTWLTQARAQTRVSRRLDGAIEGRYIAQVDGPTAQWTAAAEAGFWVTSDLRAGVGYNFKSAEMLAENFLTGSARRGFYLVLSTKLSSMFNLFPSATLDKKTDCDCENHAPTLPVVVQPIIGAQDVCAGDAVTLRTSATGGTPGAKMVYQWFVDGTAVNGATGETFTLATVGAAGVRKITVSASAGSQTATSEPVTVAVTPLLPPTIQFTVQPSTVPYLAPAMPLAATATAANSCNGAMTVVYSGEAVTGASFNPAAVGGFDPANLVREQTRTVPITATVTDARKQTASAVAPVTIILKPAATRRDIVFSNRNARVNNAAKRYLLEEVTPRLREDPNATVVLIGHRDTNEDGGMWLNLDTDRMLNTAAVLSAGTGVCPSLDLGRIQVGVAGADQSAEPLPFGDASVKERAGSASTAADQRAKFRRVEVWFVPGGAEPPARSGLRPAPAELIQALGCPK